MIDSRFMVNIFQTIHISDWRDLAHVFGWTPYNLHALGHVSGLDLYYTDPAQHLITAG